MLETYIQNMMQDLSVSRAVSSFRVLRTEVGDEDGYVSIKCKLSNGDVLEFAQYVIIRNRKINVETYSFHWQTADGKLKKRWDNVPHHKDVDTFPNHLHLPDNVVGSSPMSLKKILVDIEKTLPPNDKDTGA